ncbi:MAG: hypothetical protein U0232_21655 [Thermomicrobiales bacterium]
MSTEVLAAAPNYPPLLDADRRRAASCQARRSSPPLLDPTIPSMDEGRA